MSNAKRNKNTERRIKVALRRLSALTVRPENEPFPEYTRNEFFGGWMDWDKDGEDERAEVLIDFHRPGPGDVPLKRAATDEDRVVAGRWHCRYTGEWYSDASQIDIDHLVPLAEAWASGAHEWGREKCRQYANGFGVRNRRRTWLLPVYRGANRSKGAKRPDQWMPPREEYHPIYAALWVWTKTYWRMSVTPAEKKALEAALRGGL